MTSRKTLHAVDEPTEREQVLAVFGFGGLADLTGALSPVPTTPASDARPTLPCCSTQSP